MDVFPGEQNEIFLEHRLNPRRTEMPADGAAMLVVYDALRLIQNFPAAFPGAIAEVGVFQVERFEQGIEAAEFEIFTPVERARAAAAVKARIK